MKPQDRNPQSPNSGNYAEERKESHRGQRSDQSNIHQPNDDRGGRQSQGDAPRTGRNDKNEKR